MSLHKPSNLKTFLEKISSLPKKSLSQNFLIDGNIVDKLLTTADVQKNDIVLEIGPGPGVITEWLINKGATVIAIEKDRNFSKHLSRLDISKTSLTTINADFLELDLYSLLQPYANTNQKIKVVSNLPFKLTSPILEKIFKFSQFLDSFTVIVQKEVGLRFTAKPQTQTYSAFSVFVQLYSLPRYIHTISPNSFYPKPKVESAILHGKLRKNLNKHVPDICKFVRKAFQMKRKMLINSLKKDYSLDLLHEVFLKLGFSTTARPADLSPEDYIELYKALFKQP